MPLYLLEPEIFTLDWTEKWYITSIILLLIKSSGFSLSSSIIYYIILLSFKYL